MAHAGARGLPQRDAAPPARLRYGRRDRPSAWPGEAFGGAVDGVDVVVAIVEEVAHLLPGGWGAAVLSAILSQRLVERGEAFMGLAIGAVQVEEGAGERRRVGGGEAQVRERRGGVGEDGIGDGLAHVGDKAFGVAGAQLGDVEAELLRQAEDDGGGDRAVVVLHLVEIGQGDAELGREILLRQADAGAHLAQLGAGIEFLGWHGGLQSHPAELRRWFAEPP
jgi:hypothetical protein